MKEIYVVFSGTDLKTGRFIRRITNQKYNHACISTDGLKTLCSFSRLYLDHPMLAGFVEESPNRYLMMDKAWVKVVKIEVDNNTYAAVCQYIRRMQLRPNEYVYNYLSCAGYPVGKRIRRDKAYTCVEFVRDTLVCAGVLPSSASCVKIPTLQAELRGYKTIEGTAKEIFKNADWGSDDYLKDFGGRITVAREVYRRLWHMLLNY